MDPQKGERGWALIAVVGTLLILSTLTAGLVSISLTSVRIEYTARGQLEASAIAEAAFARAMTGILDPRVEARWRVDAVPQSFTFDGTKATVAIQDELGKIDLNATDGDTIARLLTNVGGLEVDTAQALADKIMDWREADDLKHLKGATRQDYELAGKTYAPREGPFQSVDELKLVLDMTDAIYARIASALTVYSKRPTFDPQVAPREVLLTMLGQDAAKVDETLRILDAEAWENAGPLIEELVDEVIAPYGVTAHLTYTAGVPPVVNDHSAVEALRRGVRFAGAREVQTRQSLGGEDFAWLISRVPGAMARLGTRLPGGVTYDLHQGDLVVDERSIGVAAGVLVGAAVASIDLIDAERAVNAMPAVSAAVLTSEGAV